MHAPIPNYSLSFASTISAILMCAIHIVLSLTMAHIILSRYEVIADKFFIPLLVHHQLDDLWYRIATALHSHVCKRSHTLHQIIVITMVIDVEKLVKILILVVMLQCFHPSGLLMLQIKLVLLLYYYYIIILLFTEVSTILRLWVGLSWMNSFLNLHTELQWNK